MKCQKNIIEAINELEVGKFMTIHKVSQTECTTHKVQLETSAISAEKYEDMEYTAKIPIVPQSMLNDTFTQFVNGGLNIKDNSKTPYCTALPDGAYCGAQCPELGHVTLPNCLSVGTGAFDQCDKLTSIHLPSVVYVGDNAFHSCSIVSAYIPNVTYASNGMFWMCTQLTSVTAPSLSSFSGYESFNECPILSLELPAVLTATEYALYDSSEVRTIILPNATHLGSESIGGCNAMSGLVIPKVVSIADGALDGDNALQEITLGSAVMTKEYVINNIDKWTNGTYMAYAVTIHCIDGDVIYENE